MILFHLNFKFKPKTLYIICIKNTALRRTYWEILKLVKSPVFYSKESKIK